MLKQYLLSPTCLKCGSFFCNDSLFCLVCLKKEILGRHKEQGPSHLGHQHFYLLEWNKNESDVLSQMVYRLKSDNSKSAWKFYSQFFYKKLKTKITFKDFQVIIPLPSANANSVHALIFSRELSRLSGLPTKDVLIKTSSFREQKKLTLRQRKQGSSIELKHLQGEQFTKCIFVDDVVTSGETFQQSNEAINGGCSNIILSLFYRPRLLSNTPAF